MENLVLLILCDFLISISFYYQRDINRKAHELECSIRRIEELEYRLNVSINYSDYIASHINHIDQTVTISLPTVCSIDHRSINDAVEFFKIDTGDETNHIL
jgi:hypothetical protein